MFFIIIHIQHKVFDFVVMQYLKSASLNMVSFMIKLSAQVSSSSSEIKATS